MSGCGRLRPLFVTTQANRQTYDQGNTTWQLTAALVRALGIARVFVQPLRPEGPAGIDRLLVTLIPDSETTIWFVA